MRVGFHPGSIAYTASETFSSRTNKTPQLTSKRCPVLFPSTLSQRCQSRETRRNT